MNAFVIILKHTDKFLIVSGIGNIFMTLGKMAIASITAFLGFVMMEHWTEINEKLDSPFAPTLIIFFISYVVGAVFISVYSISADTILQCFLVDTDISEKQGRNEAHHRPEALEGFIYLIKKDDNDDYTPPRSPRSPNYLD